MSTALFSDLDRKDLIWLITGALLATVFALVAYDQLFNLHFSAWRLYPNRPSTEPLAQFLRGPIAGWYRPVVVGLTFLTGGLATVRAISGAWKSLAVLAGSLLLVIAAAEFTQTLGQDTAPVSQIDHVAPVSVVWAAMLGMIPLVLLIMAVRSLRPSASGPAEVPERSGGLTRRGS